MLATIRRRPRRAAGPPMAGIGEPGEAEQHQAQVETSGVTGALEIVRRTAKYRAILRDWARSSPRTGSWRLRPPPIPAIPWQYSAPSSCLPRRPFFKCPAARIVPVDAVFQTTESMIDRRRNCLWELAKGRWLVVAQRRRRRLGVPGHRVNGIIVKGGSGKPKEPSYHSLFLGQPLRDRDRVLLGDARLRRRRLERDL
jgi:hypothetical protein